MKKLEESAPHRGSAYDEEHASGGEVGRVVLQDGGVVFNEFPNVAGQQSVWHLYAVGGSGPCWFQKLLTAPA
eukprot:12727244-Heterocapsa_arctica.AAC.1